MDITNVEIIGVDDHIKKSVPKLFRWLRNKRQLDLESREPLAVMGMAICALICNADDPLEELEEYITLLRSCTEETLKKVADQKASGEWQC